MGEVIKLTKEEIKRRFDIYNIKYFEGKLTGKCKFCIFSKNIAAFGKYTHQTYKSGKAVNYIYVGQNTVWTDEKLERIIVHEMIHMYVRTVENVKFDGLLGHGWYFRKHMRRIRKKFGLNIEVHPSFEIINKKFTPKLWERILLWLIDR